MSGLDALFTSDAEREAAKLKLTQALQAPMLGQLEINKVEAASSSAFVAGWRPSIGWVGSAALAFNYIGQPLLTWACAVWFPNITPPPSLDTGELFALVTALLGLSGTRTYEKVVGVKK